MVIRSMENWTVPRAKMSMLSHSSLKWFLRFYFIKVWEPRHCLLVSTSWHPGVAPCMHGALSTQELELHAIQFWGGAAENKGQSGPCFQMAAPGPGVSGGTQLLYLQAKTQWAQAVYSVLFCSVILQCMVKWLSLLIFSMLFTRNFFVTFSK